MSAARQSKAAIRIFPLLSALLLAASSACASDPEPTATTPATATTAATEAPAATATTPPAADPTATDSGHTEMPTAVPATDAPATATTLAATPTEPPAATEAPTPTAAPSTPPVGVNVGNTLPHFEMTLVDGSRVSTELLAHQGKPVFLYFFTTW